MVEYGCNVTNKFGFMSDDDDFEDPRELIEKVAKAEAIKAAVKKAPAPAPVKKEAEAPKPAAVGKENRPVNGERSERGARGGRGGRGRGGPREGGNRPPRAEGDLADRFGENRRGGPRGRGNGGPRPFRGRGGNVNTTGEEAPRSENTFEEVGAPAEGGDRPRRGGRGGFRGGRGRGRQFDRQSGSDRTGVRSVEKKDGHGKGNWGDVKDEIAGETEPIPTETEPQEPAAPREKTAEEMKYEADLEEYNKMKTLKEFKAQQKLESNEFKTRKAGEGVQENYGKLIPLQKTDSNKDEEVIVMRKESNKKILNIDIHFLEANRGRPEAGTRGGARGNRGGNRGSRGAGGYRGGAGGQRSHGGSHFDASSAEDFPALK